jgi:hypothetical protein
MDAGRERCAGGTLVLLAGQAAVVHPGELDVNVGVGDVHRPKCVLRNVRSLDGCAGKAAQQE